MQVMTRVDELRANLIAGESLLIPTMGNLHAGHLFLVDKARQNRATHGLPSKVVASIFANRLQFAPTGDFH